MLFELCVAVEDHGNPKDPLLDVYWPKAGEVIGWAHKGRRQWSEAERNNSKWRIVLVELDSEADARALVVPKVQLEKDGRCTTLAYRASKLDITAPDQKLQQALADKDAFTKEVVVTKEAMATISQLKPGVAELNVQNAVRAAILNDKKAQAAAAEQPDEPAVPAVKGG